MWSPWSNKLEAATTINMPLQSYGKNTIFQPSFPCKVCGLSGCGNNHGNNEFPNIIRPEEIFIEVEKWFLNL